MDNHIILIGAGVIGMMTARELIAAGNRVTIIDKQDAGREASWAGAGILSPLYPWAYAEPVIRLALWSQSRYQQIAEDLLHNTGIDPEWQRSGMLILPPYNRENAVKCCENFDITHDLLEKEQIASVFPGLVNTAAAIWLPAVAQVRNPRLLTGLKRDLMQKGCHFIERNAVTGFLVERQRLFGVALTNDELRADACVVTAGAWSAELLKTTGLDLPIYPVRGQMLLLKGEPDLVPHLLLQNHQYIVPRRDGHILIGSTQERSGFDKSITDTARQQLHHWAISQLPVLQYLAIVQQWSGLRPGSDDSIPFIGAHPQIDGLYFCAGHFRNGLVTAPGSAQLLVDLLLNRAPTFDPQPFSWAQRAAA